MQDLLDLHVQVCHVPLSGGFWGLREANGQKWQPKNLPAAFQVEGQWLRVKARPLSLVSIFMWGKTIELVSVEPA